MNEEKLISILRYFGVSRCRPKVSTYKIAKVFGLQWKSAQRWARIMSALPQENWSEARVKALHAKYVAIDAGGDPDEEANEVSGASGIVDNKYGIAYDPIDASDEAFSDELGLAWGNNPNKESTELEYTPLGDGTTPRTAPSTDSERRASGDLTSDSDKDSSTSDKASGIADRTAYGYDPEGSLV